MSDLFNQNATEAKYFEELKNEEALANLISQ